MGLQGVENSVKAHSGLRPTNVSTPLQRPGRKTDKARFRYSDLVVIELKCADSHSRRFGETLATHLSDYH